MNSLSELNQHNQDFVLNYTDERPAQIVFSRTVPVNVSSSALQGYNTELTLGIDILDIVQGETLDIKLEVDLSSISLASLTWDTIPSGCTATQIGNKYIMSGITTLAQWKLINNPSIIVNMYNDGSYSYNASIKYQLTGDKSWSVSLRISQGARLNSNYNFFADSQRLIAPTFYYDSFFDLQTFGGRVRFGTGTVNVTSNYNINSDSVYAIFGDSNISSKYDLYCNSIKPKIGNAILNGSYIIYCYPVKPLVSKYTINLYNPYSTSDLMRPSSTYSDTYQTNTITTINSAYLLNDFPGFPDGTTQSIDIVPSTTSAINTLYINPWGYASYSPGHFQNGEGFGSSVAMTRDGKYVVIGSPNFDGVASNSGGISYYNHDTNTISDIVKLNFSAGDRFGTSVAISNNATVVAVGSPYDDNSGGSDAGSVYILNYSGTGPYFGTGFVRLQASDAIGNDQFGMSVSISGDGTILAVGSPYDDNSGGSNSGSVYIFMNSGGTWIEQTRLQAATPNANDFFGYSVSISENADVLAIGSFWDDNSGGTDAGSCYIFTNSGGTWTEQARLQASDAALNDRFGYSVSISNDGNSVVIGSPYDNNSVGNNGTGSCYIFTNSGGTWTEQARLQASDAALNDQFGWAVSISGDGNTIAVGAPYNDNLGGTDAGSIYIYTKTGSYWNEITKIKPIEPLSYKTLGTCVSLTSDGKSLGSGTPTDDIPLMNGKFIHAVKLGATTSFNSTTKILNISGSIQEIHSATSNIQFTPATGYTSNFTLQYRYYEPGSTTKYVYRTQNITHV